VPETWAIAESDKAIAARESAARVFVKERFVDEI